MGKLSHDLRRQVFNVQKEEYQANDPKKANIRIHIHENICSAKLFVRIVSKITFRCIQKKTGCSLIISDGFHPAIEHRQTHKRKTESATQHDLGYYKSVRAARSCPMLTGRLS